ncbi:MAG: c-type cytochrome domain-containing protein, partial [Verrucomicrobiota bacterium]
MHHLRNLTIPFLLLSVSSGLSNEDAIDFGRDIRPILSDKCFFCHGPDEEERKADLRLDLKADAFAAKNGVAAFVAGNADESEAWHRILSDDPDDVMPPPEVNKPLSEKEKNLIRRWIEEGAEWTEHWSFVTPKSATPPPVPEPHPEEVTHPIDAFILSELETRKLAPSPLADRRTLIRRITFDLTGLPPTREEVDAFLGDDTPKAYEKV